MPAGPWPKIVLSAFFVVALFIAAMEVRLAVRGFRPTATDSEWSWIVQRERASQLGNRALILVGASRVLLDVDLDVLRRATGLEPVQLAIDGSSFVPVLDDLAADPSITGTVLVGYQDNVIASTDGESAAAGFIAAWQRHARAHGIPTFSSMESALTDRVHGWLRSYADGARPITSLVSRIVAPHPTPQYLITMPDRSWLADYSKVDMPGFYYGRVQRTLGETVPAKPGMTWADLDAEIRRRIDAMPPADASLVDERSQRIAAMVRKIEARGGHVDVAAFPTDGLVRAIDEKRYPRATFLDRFAGIVGTKTISPADVPALAAFKCPDGSHIDYRDRPAFTAALTDALAGGVVATASHGGL
ncbi:MAG TPA: hypothetical protein VFV97_05755 [Rhodanobacteraceae bacterium]|nr:hypothetical protein [Rhodanobacteraceae bacterium]